MLYSEIEFLFCFVALTVQVVNASTTQKITYDDAESENMFSIPVFKGLSNGKVRLIHRFSNKLIYSLHSEVGKEQRWLSCLIY